MSQWMVKDHEAVNIDAVVKATAFNTGGNDWEVRVQVAGGLYIVDSVHTSEMMAVYRIANMNTGPIYKTPNAKGVVAPADNKLFVYFGGIGVLNVGVHGGAYAAFSMPKGESHPASALVLKTGTEQECKDYLTGLYSNWN